MKVSLADIRDKFDALVSGSETREAVADFATQAIIADDNSSLECAPPSDRQKIWDAIVYLSGVDLKNSPDEYFHVTLDFVDFRRELGV